LQFETYEGNCLIKDSTTSTAIADVVKTRKYNENTASHAHAMCHYLLAACWTDW